LIIGARYEISMRASILLSRALHFLSNLLVYI